MKKFISIFILVFIIAMINGHAQSSQQGQPVSSSRDAIVAPGQSAVTLQSDTVGNAAKPAKNSAVSTDGQTAPAITPPGSGTQQPGDKKNPNR